MSRSLTSTTGLPFSSLRSIGLYALSFLESTAQESVARSGQSIAVWLLIAITCWCGGLAGRLVAQNDLDISWQLQQTATETWTNKGGAISVSVSKGNGQASSTTATSDYSGTATGSAYMSTGYIISGPFQYAANGSGAITITDTTTGEVVYLFTDVNSVVSPNAYNAGMVFQSDVAFEAVSGHTYTVSASMFSYANFLAVAGIDLKLPFEGPVLHTNPVIVTTPGFTILGSSDVSKDLGTVRSRVSPIQPLRGGVLSDIVYTLTSFNPAATLVFSNTQTSMTTDPKATIIARHNVAPRLLGTALTSNGVLATFAVDPGSSYLVQTSTNLSDWTATGPASSFTSGVVQQLLPLANTGFLRVVSNSP